MPKLNPKHAHACRGNLIFFPEAKRALYQDMLWPVPDRARHGPRKIEETMQIERVEPLYRS